MRSRRSWVLYRPAIALLGTILLVMAQTSVETYPANSAGQQPQAADRTRTLPEVRTVPQAPHA